MDNPPYFALSDEQRRVLLDAMQLHEATQAALVAATQFRGSMSWKTVKDRDYLYRANQSGRWSSLGPRTSETELVYQRFIDGKQHAQLRLSGLEERSRLQAKYVAANRLGRLPKAAIAAITSLTREGFTFRIVGTHALYGYEPMAGIQFLREITATEDIDVMFDGRRRLRLLSDADNTRPLMTALKKADASYEQVSSYRAVNASGFMVDVISPAWRPLVTNPNLSAHPGELTPAELAGLSWLANSPAITSTVFGLTGEPIDIHVPDPRFFAVHKLYVANAPDRHPLKAARDYSQAMAVSAVVQSLLPWLSFADPALTVFPEALRQQASTAFKVQVGPKE